MSSVAAFNVRKAVAKLAVYAKDAKIYRCSACLSTFPVPMMGLMPCQCPSCDAVIVDVRES